MSWTQPADITTRWLGTTSLPTDSQLDTLIGDAEDIISVTFSDIQARIDATTLPLERVVRVASNMVMRYLRNPDGMRQTSTTTGPFTNSATYGGDEPGTMYMTDKERDDLSGVSQSGAFSVDTVGSTTIHADTCALNFGATYCSCGADIAGYPLYGG